MVHLVLDGLGRDAGDCTALLFEVLVAIAHRDGCVALHLAHARKRQAAFFRVVRFRGVLDDFGIHHHEDFRIVHHGEDADARADHVRREADAMIGVRHERVREVAGEREVGFRRGARGEGEEDRVVEDGLGGMFFAHDKSLLSLRICLFFPKVDCGEAAIFSRWLWRQLIHSVSFRYRPRPSNARNP